MRRSSALANIQAFPIQDAEAFARVLPAYYVERFLHKADALIRNLVCNRCLSIEKFARYRLLVQFMAHREWGASSSDSRKCASFSPCFALSLWRAVLCGMRKVVSAYQSFVSWRKASFRSQWIEERPSFVSWLPRQL